MFGGQGVTGIRKYLYLLSAIAVFATSASAYSAQQSLTIELEAPKVSSESGSRKSTDKIKLGRVGLVTANYANIYKSKSTSSKVYSVVKNETPLAIIQESDADWYGVLMTNGSTGWISKKCIKLTNYELVSSSLGRIRTTPVSRAGTNVDRSGAGINELVKTAISYQNSGIYYVFGGTNPNGGMDCSAFVRMVFGQYGFSLPRTAREQAQVGTSIPFDQLQPGDRLYFSCKNPYIDHCGIYVGNGYFVHCSKTRNGVGLDSLASDFYWRTLVVAKRSL